MFWDEIGDVAEQNSEIKKVGDTEISGFNEVQDRGNEEIADYISEMIPLEHLNSCPEIAYKPEDTVFHNPYCLGAYCTETREILIASEKRFEDYDSMLDTLTHEIGHNEHARLEELHPDVATKWENLYSESLDRQDGFGFVSDYAKTSHFEDFAESYGMYIRDPERLKVMSPEKYSFMKYNVFDGREYGQAVLNNGIFTSMDQFMADILKNVAEHSGSADNLDVSKEIQASEDAAQLSKTYRCFSCVA